MATGAHKGLRLGEDDNDLNELYELLFPMCFKYKSLGLRIGLTLNEIKRIEAEQVEQGNRLLEVLSLRMNKAKPLMWNDIEMALRSQSVNEIQLAEVIREKYGLALEKQESTVREYLEDGKFTEQSCPPMLKDTVSQNQDSDKEMGKSNISDNMSKKIREIFESFFGELCSSIVDPVKTAAQLQKKGVISRSKMREMIMSPESQQSKTIHLVDELDNVLQSHPDTIFDVIQILIEIDGLENIGRDLLRETGTVCPEIISERFSHHIITIEHGVTSTNEGTPHGIPTTTSDIKPSIPQEASQPVPNTRLSPNMMKYKHYLQACYNARALAPADKYLPTLQAPYINLAMVHREYAAPEDRNEFIKQTLHGGVDEILLKKVPIKFEDIFKPVEESKKGDKDTVQQSETNKQRPPRFVLVEGPPGIGKSTFSWEVCRRWDLIAILRDYLLLLLLKLREKWVLNATSLADLFRCEYDPELSKLIADELIATQGEGLLLILDGFDEVSHSFHQNSIIKSILCRRLLPACTIILTTRPSAMNELKEICQPQVDKHIEIIGFTEEERVKYITEVFSKEPQLQANFLRYMFLIPHIKSMMYIPLNCAIIAQVYHESQSSQHLAIPKTRTQLYGALTNSLIVRHMKTVDSNIKYDSILPEGLNEEEKERFRVLAKFAFDSYHQWGSSRKVTFFKEDIPEGLVHFGFINESSEMYAGKGVEKTFSFLHLSLQEYLAAWHLAQGFSVDFQVTYHKIAVKTSSHQYRRHDITYEGESKTEHIFLESLKEHGAALMEPAVFLAGITGWKHEASSEVNRWQTYFSHDTSEWNDRDLILLRSLYESQNPSLCPYYFDSNTERRKLKFCNESQSSGEVDEEQEDLYEDIYESVSFNYTPYDCYALSYCVSNGSGTFSLSLHFKRKFQLVETFIRGLNDHIKSTPPVIKTLELQLFRGNSEYSEKCIRWMCKCSCWGAAEEFHFRYDNQPGLELVTMLFQSLHNVKTISVNPTPLDLLPFFNSSTKLEKLDITLPTEGKLQPSGLDCELITYKLYKDVLSDVCNLILHSPSLVTLELKETKLGYDGILFICSALKHNTTLTHLVIHDDYIQPEESLSEPREGDSLPKSTSTDLLLKLSSILKNNNTVNEINIHCGPYRNKSFSFMFNGNTTEVVVSKISRDTMAGVCNFILHCPSLVSLELKSMKLGYDGILFICSALRHNNKLTHLMINVSPEWLSVSQDLQLSGKEHTLLDKTFPDLLLELSNILKNNKTVKVTIGISYDYGYLHVAFENNTTKIDVYGLSHDAMAGVRNLILHCPSLVSLELKETKLGYDGILFICSSLRHNTTLTHLVIDSSIESKKSFSESQEGDSLPKSTSTHLLLELSRFLKNNNTVRKINICCGRYHYYENESFFFMFKDNTTEVVVSEISRDTMTSVHNLILNCPRLVSFKLNVTKLGYDGILFICSALRHNNTLTHLVIRNHTESEESLSESQEGDSLSKSTSTGLLLGLSNILKNNNTVNEINIHCGPYRNKSFSFMFKGNTTEVVVSEISRDTMAGVRNFILHCPSLVSLELNKTKLGYDGILFICSSLRHNTTLTHLVIHNHTESEESLSESQEGDSLSKSTSTGLLLGLSNILKNNNTVNEINIHCGPYRNKSFSFMFKGNTTKVVVSEISRDTITGVHSLILHCPSLVSLELKETKLGYDGILFICSALRHNTTLTHLVIDDQTYPADGTKLISVQRCELLPPLPPQSVTLSLSHTIQPAPPPLDLDDFSHKETETIHSCCTCTDFLLELNSILKNNSNLEEIDIQSGLFFPLCEIYGDYDDSPLTFISRNGFQWTGLGPLQQFNVRAIANGRCLNLRRSFSVPNFVSEELFDSNMHDAFSSWLSSVKGISFTAPDTHVLQSFSNLDPVFCLASISHQYIGT